MNSYFYILSILLVINVNYRVEVSKILFMVVILLYLSSSVYDSDYCTMPYTGLHIR